MGSSASDREGLMSPFVITASVLGIIQGVAWTVLSLLAIFIYNNTMCIGTDAYSDMGTTICSLYLMKKGESGSTNTTKNESVIIRPKEFNYFMYLYLVLSFCLFVISSAMLRNGLHGERNSFHTKTIGAWVGTMALVSLLDHILMCLIAYDYTRYKSGPDSIYGQDLSALQTSEIEQQVEIVLAAVGIVMAVAARGFVLWVVNVVFAVILGKFCYKTYKKHATQNQPFIDAYETRPKPWLTDPTYDDPFQSGYDNKGFNHDQDNSMFPPRAKQQPFADDRNQRNDYNNRETESRNVVDLPPAPNNNNNHWNNKNQLHREGPNSSPYGPRTAKIGRQGGQRSPPLNVSSPYIPDPDYSPPGSPRPRGVLRPKTNYAMY